MENTIRRWGYIVGGIHGDKTQDQRNTALQNFRDGSVPLLVATDVAARGLDIPDVEVVLNYSFPLTTEDCTYSAATRNRGNNRDWLGRALTVVFLLSSQMSTALGAQGAAASRVSATPSSPRSTSHALAS